MKKFLLMSMIVFFFLSGCGTAVVNTPKYYWGDYSQTLYKNKKDQTPESYQNYKNALTDIVEKSKADDFVVPPGIYSEYGFILAQEGKLEEAKFYLALEKEKYPESTVFVDRLMKAIGGSL